MGSTAERLDELDINDWFTFRDLAADSPDYITLNTLEWTYRHRETNGFADCFTKWGKMRLVSKSRLARKFAEKAGHDLP
jgi:hypothetical protein